METVVPQVKKDDLMSDRLFSKKNTGHFSLCVLTIIIIVFREKHYLIYPRFWAEEGVVFFAFARTHGIIETLFQPHLGYYSLFANLASILAAKLVPLEKAPLVTTIMAMVGQCAPIALVIFGRSRYWQGLFRKMVVLAIIFLAPLSYEVWLNSINSQFFLCLFSVLLLLEPQTSGGLLSRSVLHRSGLLLAGLTGVVSCFLVPVYWLRAYREKTRECVLLALILTFCLFVQTAVVVSSRSGEVDAKTIMMMGVSVPSRSVHFSPSAMGNILFVKTILLNFLGVSLSEPVAKNIHGLWVKGTIGGQIVGYGALLSVVAFWLYLIMRCPIPVRWLVPGAFVLLVIPSVVFALVDSMAVLINPYAAQRYFYVPNILVLLMLYCAIDWDGIKKKIRCENLFLLILFFAAFCFLGGEFRNFQGKGNVYDASWPRWKDEIFFWRQDASYPVKIWPAPQWRMKIDP